MIDQAIATNDHDYIAKYWQTTIANAWNSLSEDQIGKLNKIIQELK